MLLRHLLSGHGRTRAEFEGWARTLAAAHGYDVHFEGVGRLRPEILRAMPPAFADVVAAEPGLGCATQVAMFVQRKPASQAPHAEAHVSRPFIHAIAPH